MKLSVKLLELDFVKQTKYPEGSPVVRVYATRDIQKRDEIFVRPITLQTSEEFKFTVDKVLQQGHSGVRVDLFAQSTVDNKPFYQSCGSVIKRFGDALPDDAYVVDWTPDFGASPVIKGRMHLKLEASGKTSADHQPIHEDEMEDLFETFGRKIQNYTPVVRSLRNFHCIRYVTGTKGITLPYFAFLWNKPYETPTDYFQSCLNVALQLHSLDEKQYCDLWKEQKANVQKRHALLDKLVSISVQTISMFVYSIPYVDDHTATRSGVLDTEDLQDCRFSKRGDCEDLARAIIMNYKDVMLYERKGAGMETLKDILSEYTPALSIDAVKCGNASLDAQNDNDSFTCHCMGFLIPNGIAARFTEAVPAARFAFMPMQVLEGTTPMETEKKPMWKIMGGNPDEWKKLSKIQHSRINLGANVIKQTEIFSVDENVDGTDQFYYYITDLFFDRIPGRKTFSVIPSCNGSVDAPYSRFMNEPEMFSAAKTMELDESRANRISLLLWSEPPVPSLKYTFEQSEKDALEKRFPPIKPGVEGIDYWFAFSDLDKVRVPEGMVGRAVYAPINEEAHFVLRLSNY